ncbi:MAG: ATP-binding cassette domain-containing protein [Anaerolineae bacterium]|nr:ATP-binding cassette domain-containing protein [Anaerolineae bacterium]MDH7475241.1 ATP-binding cassette domain-containing protein [Anaerolineae bacterium]
MDHAIEVNDLTKIYGQADSGVLAVDHINFAVRQGEVFGFLGPNGAGKTTTQRMLTTLLEPTEGRIVILGHDLAREPYPVKRQMGLVPEESNVYTELTAWDNLMFTAQLYRVPRAERAERARQLLETFGLWEKRSVKVENFSKGMRRRLSIAMAIIHRPSLLFLDEPTPGLDVQSARAIRDLIRQLNAEGTTIFLTTHQIEEANQLCDRVAIINHGHIAATDTPERLKATFRRVQSVEVALEPPEGLEPSGGWGEALTALPGVTTAVKMGDKWRLYTEDPSALLPQVMDYARANKLKVISLSTLGPSLEDVFLELTGQQVGTVRHETQDDRPRRGMKGRMGGGR